MPVTMYLGQQRPEHWLWRLSVKTVIRSPGVSLRQGSIALVSLYLCGSQLDYTLLSCAGIRGPHIFSYSRDGPSLSFMSTMAQWWAASRPEPIQKQQRPGSAGSEEESRTGLSAVATGTTWMSWCSKCAGLTPKRCYPTFSTFIKLLLTFPSLSEEAIDEGLVPFAL